MPALFAGCAAALPASGGAVVLAGVSASPPKQLRLRARHVVVAIAVAGVLLAGTIWRPQWFLPVLMLLGYVVLIGGATWYFVAQARHYHRQEEAGTAVVNELKLERDSASETGNGGYPCESVWQCHRGLFDGARIKWLKVWVGSSQRGRTVWIASTEIFPAFEQEFRLDASYSSKPVPAPHQRLPANREIWWQPQEWIARWLDSLPEATASALHAFLSEDRHTVVTGRVVFCFVPGLAAEGAPAAHATFRELIALARLLSKSAEEINPFSIHTSFHYVRYQEGKNSFELAIDPGQDSSWVYVPTLENWPKQVPAWAAGRREQIVGRLRTHLEKSFEFIDC